MELNKHTVGFVWFTGRTSICVAVWWSEEETALRAGIATVPGIDQEEDINFTVDWGSRFPLEEAIALINRQGGWVKPEKEMWYPKPETDGPFKMKLKYKNEAEQRRVGKPITVMTDDSGSTQFHSNKLL